MSEAIQTNEAGGRRRQWRRVTLSDRDWEILAWANEQKFLTFEQVARWFPEREPNPHRAPTIEPSKRTLGRERPAGELKKLFE